MIAEIRIPKLGMTQEDIVVVEITLQNGDAVGEEDKIAAIETAKVTYDLEATVSGFVFYLKPLKAKVAIGQVLAVVADTHEAFEAYKGALPTRDEEDQDILFDDEDGEEGVALFFEEDEPEAPALEAPVLDLTGRKILKRIPYVGMRRTIAHNLHSSLQAGAQLTIVAEADMTELSHYRNELRLDFPQAKITYVDLLVKILAGALKAFPIVNSAISGDDIVCWDEVHMGVAVALEQGLVVPVVRDADKKSLVQVSRQIKSLAQKARDNALAPEHYTGGTFTLSSGGKVDTEIITPIINPPENAILAIGRIGPKPAVHEGKLAVRTMTYLCLTHDHRVIDGVPASQFLGRVKEIIENPEIFRKIAR
jgi:pyruvate/2-oxoglutarate dehydrogenase complex dihydrolipoamide acyltransferase (E2) component